MRKFLLAITALAVVGVAALSTPASASGYKAVSAAGYDYPWCVLALGWEYPGECAYQTYGQCMASASGRYADRNVNPRVAFARQRSGRNPYPQY